MFIIEQSILVTIMFYFLYQLIEKTEDTASLSVRVSAGEDIEIGTTDDISSINDSNVLDIILNAPLFFIFI